MTTIYTSFDGLTFHDPLKCHEHEASVLMSRLKDTGISWNDAVVTILHWWYYAPRAQQEVPFLPPYSGSVRDFGIACTAPAKE